MSCRTSTRLLANECMAALIGSTVRWMGGEWILRFKWGTICYFWLADCFWTVGECLFVAENAYTWRYLENTVSKIGGKILDLQPLVSVIMSQSWAPYCGLFAHETVGFHDFWDSSRFVLSLETRNLATVVYLGLSQVASTLGTPKSYGLPSVYPVKLLAEHVSFRDKPLLCRWCGKSLDGFVSRISCCLDLFKKGRKFPLSCPCYHPQYVSTIFRISPLLVDKSYITSLGFSENSAPPDLNRFSRHSLLKLLWDVVGIPPFFPRWIRRAQFCWSSARRKWRIWCVIICWTPSHLTVSERLRPTDDGQRKSFASSLTDRISVKDDFYGIYNHIISHIYIYAHIHMRA